MRTITRYNTVFYTTDETDRLRCVCGSLLTYASIKQHVLSSKHTAFLNSNPRLEAPVPLHAQPIPTRDCDICMESKSKFVQCDECSNAICIDCRHKLRIPKCPFCRADIRTFVDYCVQGDLDTVIQLVQEGEDLHARNEMALRRAIYHKQYHVAEWLLQHGADVDVGNGVALKYAVLHGNLEIVRWLIGEYGAEVRGSHIRVAGDMIVSVSIHSKRLGLDATQLLISSWTDIIKLLSYNVNGVNA